MGHDIKWQFPVGPRHDQGRVDAALMGDGGKPEALIEAKAPGEPLDNHFDQLLRYAFRVAAPICVLTNGAEWRLYLPRADGDAPERMFARVDFTADDPADAAAVLFSYLGRRRLRSGAAARDAKQALEKVWGRTRARESLPGVWRQIREEPEPVLVDLVVARAEKACGYAPDIQDVVDLIRSAHPATPSTAPVVAGPATPPRYSGETAAPTAPPEPAPVVRKKGSPTKPPEPFYLFGEEVVLDRWSWRQLAEEIVRRVYRRHPGTFRATVLAAKTWEGASWPMASAGSPYNDDYKEVADGLYFPLARSSESHRRQIDHLLTVFGYDPARERTDWGVSAVGGGGGKKKGSPAAKPPEPFYLFGEEIKMDRWSWKGLSEAIARALHRRHPETFRQTVLAATRWEGTSQPMASEGTPHNTHYARVTGDFYFPVFSSAKWQRVQMDHLLTLFGYEPAEVRTDWGATEDEAVPGRRSSGPRRSSPRPRTLTDRTSGKEATTLNWQHVMEEIMKTLAAENPYRSEVWEGFSFTAAERYKNGRSPSIPGTGLYLGTNLNTAGIRERIAVMAESFGERGERWRVRLADGEEVAAGIRQ